MAHKLTFVGGTHTFHVVGYDLSKLSNSSVKSGDFHAGGHTWALVCGFDKEGHLASVSLELLSANVTRGVVAKAGLRIDDPLHRWPAAVWRSGGVNTFFANSRSWDLSVPDAFRGRDERYVKDDCLTVLCAVDVLKEKDSTAAPSQSISRDLRQLLELGSKSDRRASMRPDVTFVVEQTEIHAHKLVLAMRSPVFAAEFRWHVKDDSVTHARVEIEDMSASTFRAMVRFIYTDELPIKYNNGVALTSKEKYVVRCREAMAIDLLVAADRYDLERLRLMCEDILSQSIDVASVIPTLMAVQGRHSCKQLENSCIEYLASNPDVYTAVEATEEYKELSKTYSPFVDEVRNKVATHKVTDNVSLETGNHRRCPDKSISTYNFSESEVVCGTHEFRIDNFSAVQRSYGVNQAIKSDIFHVGWYDWRLAVYPSGFSSSLRKKETRYISVFLDLMNDLGIAGVRTSMRFKMDDPSCKSWPWTRELLHHVYGGLEWGYPKFISLKSAKSKYVQHDGSLTIHCEVMITKEACTSSSATSAKAMTPVAVPPSNIACQLEKLLLSEQGSDVRFLVENSEIRAHKLVLAARSPALFEAANGDDHIVPIHDMKATVFKALLHFIYTDELPEDCMAMVGLDAYAHRCMPVPFGENESHVRAIAGKVHFERQRAEHTEGCTMSQLPSARGVLYRVHLSSPHLAKDLIKSMIVD